MASRISWADLEWQPYPKVILDEVGAVGRVGLAVFAHDRAGVNQFRNHTSLVAAKLRFPNFDAGVQPDYEMIEVKPQPEPSTISELAAEGVDMAFASRVLLV